MWKSRPFRVGLWFVMATGITLTVAYRQLRAPGTLTDGALGVALVIGTLVCAVLTVVFAVDSIDDSPDAEPDPASPATMTATAAATMTAAAMTAAAAPAEVIAATPEDAFSPVVKDTPPRGVRHRIGAAMEKATTKLVVYLVLFPFLCLVGGLVMQPMLTGIGIGEVYRAAVMREQPATVLSVRTVTKVNTRKGRTVRTTYRLGLVELRSGERHEVNFQRRPVTPERQVQVLVDPYGFARPTVQLDPFNVAVMSSGGLVAAAVTHWLAWRYVRRSVGQSQSQSQGQSRGRSRSRSRGRSRSRLADPARG